MDIKELEKRITAMEDLEEIKKMHCEYMSCHDNLQFAKALDFFTDEAEVEVRNSGVMKGRENYSKIFLGTLSRRTERHDGHLVSQPVLNIDGNKAMGHWIVYMFFSKPTIEWIQVRHDCEYVKENGKWKILKLKWYMYFFAPYFKGWVSPERQCDKNFQHQPPDLSSDGPSEDTFYPSPFICPFHFTHPVTDRATPVNT